MPTRRLNLLSAPYLLVRAVAVTLVGCLILMLLAWFMLRLRAHRTDAILRATAQVEAGRTRLSDFRRAAAEAGAPREALLCSERQCRFSYTATNWPLYLLRLAPVTEISIGVLFEDGLASELSVDAAVGTHGELAHVTFNQMDYENLSCGAEACLWKHGGTAEQPRTIAIQMSHRADVKRRMRALAIDTHCIVRLGGCTSAEELLPGALSRLGSATK